MNLIKTSNENESNDYAVIKDKEFKIVCDKLFDESWNNKSERFISDKKEILDRILKTLIYTRIISDKLD